MAHAPTHPCLPFSFLVCAVFALGACSAELQDPTLDESQSGATGVCTSAVWTELSTSDFKAGDAPYVLTGTDFKRSDLRVRIMAQPGRSGNAGIDRAVSDDETFDRLSKQKTVSYEIVGPASTVRGTWDMTTLRLCGEPVSSGRRAFVVLRIMAPTGKVQDQCVRFGLKTNRSRHQLDVRLAEPTSCGTSEGSATKGIPLDTLDAPVMQNAQSCAFE